MSTWTGNPSATRDGTLKMQLWCAGGIICYFWYKHDILPYRMLGYGQGIPELGSPYGPAGADEEFQYTAISCKGDEENLLDCSLK